VTSALVEAQQALEERGEDLGRVLGAQPEVPVALHVLPSRRALLLDVHLHVDLVPIPQLVHELGVGLAALQLQAFDVVLSAALRGHEELGREVNERRPKLDGRAGLADSALGDEAQVELVTHHVSHLGEKAPRLVEPLAPLLLREERDLQLDHDRDDPIDVDGIPQQLREHIGAKGVLAALREGDIVDAAPVRGALAEVHAEGP
jgi:hypothetical protein